MRDRPRSPRATRALAGRRIVVTRAREQAGDLIRALSALGAEVVAAPTIRVVPVADLDALRAALTAPEPYDWIVFTSQNAVAIVCERLAAWGLGPAALARVNVAAIGPATAAALRRRGIEPALVPERFVAEAVVTALAARCAMRGKRVLVPRARAARDALPDGLRALGAVVDVLPVYETVREPGDGGALAEELLAGRIDAVSFTSSSTVRGFVDLVGRAAAGSGRFAAVVIGPVTARTAREQGISAIVEADEYTVGGLVTALVRHLTQGGGKDRR
jgi:uroporphyrinogen III methyltransferase / synthase